MIGIFWILYHLKPTVEVRVTLNQVFLDFFTSWTNPPHRPLMEQP